MGNRQFQENRKRDHKAKRKQLMEAKLNAIKNRRYQEEMNKLYANKMVKAIDVVLSKEGEKHYKALFS